MLQWPSGINIQAAVWNKSRKNIFESNPIKISVLKDYFGMYLWVDSKRVLSWRRFAIASTIPLTFRAFSSSWNSSSARFALPWWWPLSSNPLSTRRKNPLSFLLRILIAWKAELLKIDHCFANNSYQLLKCVSIFIYKNFFHFKWLCVHSFH